MPFDLKLVLMKAKASLNRS